MKSDSTWVSVDPAVATNLRLDGDVSDDNLTIDRLRLKIPVSKIETGKWKAEIDLLPGRYTNAQLVNLNTNVKVYRNSSQWWQCPTSDYFDELVMKPGTITETSILMLMDQRDILYLANSHLPPYETWVESGAQIKSYPYVADNGDVVVMDQYGGYGGVFYHAPWTSYKELQFPDTPVVTEWYTCSPRFKVEDLSGTITGGNAATMAAVCKNTKQNDPKYGAWRTPTPGEAVMILNLSDRGFLRYELEKQNNANKTFNLARTLGVPSCCWGWSASAACVYIVFLEGAKTDDYNVQHEIKQQWSKLLSGWKGQYQPAICIADRLNY